MSEVAGRAGVAEVYAREWLKHQAASGYVRYDPSTGSFELPSAVAAALADDGQSGLVEGFATMLATMAGEGGRIEEAFRTGAGVGWYQRSASHWHGTRISCKPPSAGPRCSYFLPTAMDHGSAARAATEPSASSIARNAILSGTGYLPVMGGRYDALCAFGETTALHPLHLEAAAPSGECDTYPWST